MAEKGLDLSREYFINTAMPRLKQDFPDLFPRLAAGLAGNGSECFGYDDETSRDHDWGTDFYLWVQEADKDRIPELESWKTTLMTFNPPPYPRRQSEYGASIRVMTCGTFYKQLVGTPDTPGDILQWFRIPENNLAMCVNGEVFMDNAGEFSAIRARFLQHYPEDFRRKKISAKCMAIAQTGQYNLRRMAARGESVTVFTTLAKFVDAVTGLVFLLNKVYRPYYKWENRALRELPISGNRIGDLLRELVLPENLAASAADTQERIISEICRILHSELTAQGLTSSDDWFFSTHGEEVRSRIQNQVLRSLPATYE